MVLGLLAWSASGAAGPGRLAHVGPDPLLVGAFGALEVAVPSVLAMVVSLRSFLGHDDDDAGTVPAGGARPADDVETGPQPVLSGTPSWSRSSTGAVTAAGPSPERSTGLSPERATGDRAGLVTGSASDHDETTDLGAEPLVSSSGGQAGGQTGSEAGSETDRPAGRRRRLAERIRRLRPHRRADGADRGDHEDSGDHDVSGDHADGGDGTADVHGGPAARSGTRAPWIAEADTDETAVVETGPRASGDRVHDPREVDADTVRAARDRDRDRDRDREEHDDERDGPAPWWRRLGSTGDRPAPGHDDDETEPVRGLDR